MTESTHLRRVLAAALAIALAVVGLTGTARPADAAGHGLTLSVFHHNDAESAILGDDEFGGAARFVNATWRLRFEARVAGREWLMVNAGDSYLASPEFSANPPWRMYDSTYQNMVKYDAMAIGNHEFDFGPDQFETFVSGFIPGGSPPPFVSANLDFSNEPGLQRYVDDGIIGRSVVVERDGHRIGIVGATTEALPFISTPRDVIVNEVVPAVQAEVDALTADGVEIIILVSHLQGIGNEIEAVAELRGVDAVIGGGGDELLANDGDLLIPGDEAEGVYPLVATDADGNDVPVATGPGDLNYIGELILTFDGAGNVTDVSGGPHRVSGVGPDAVTSNGYVERNIIAPISAFVADLETNVIANAAVDLNGERAGGIRTNETGLGSLIADSLLWQANELADGVGAPPADIAIQNGGGIRNNDIIPAGPITELDTFEILPFANFVTIIADLPPAQIKEIFENAYSQVEDVNGRFAQVAGMSVVYDPGGVAQELGEELEVITPGSRIVSITLDDGTPIVADGAVVAGAPNLNVATIDFLARGGDQYPYRDAPFTLLGASYQQALSNYIQGPLGGQITAEDYPFAGDGRISTGG